MKRYHPESYWSEVAQRIEKRGKGNIVAGDDTPFYRYKRSKFLNLLLSLDFQNKSVLEIGHGPGGNLLEIMKLNPSTLAGVDISDNMIKLATSNLESDQVILKKTNGTHLDFADQTFDLVFSSTVLQHNSNDEMMEAMFREMFRVSADRVVIFERIEHTRKGDDLCIGRPVSTYQNIAEDCGFELEKSDFINIQVSYLVCGAIRKIFSPGYRKEGEKLSNLSIFLQKAALPVTRRLDYVFKAKRDLGQLIFVRKR